MYDGLMDRIYLDNAATTAMSSEVRYALCNYLNEKKCGNPDSTHFLGREANNDVELARAKVAAALGAKPEQIIFTSGGSEGNNTVIRGVVMDEGKNAVAVSAVEHSSVFDSAINAYGDNILRVDVSADGEVTPGMLDDVLKRSNIKVGLVSVMMVNNELGTTNNVKELARVSHENGALFHTDCVQGFGQYDIRANDWDVDFLTVSAHKVHGMQGVGAIYVKDKARLHPLIVGSEVQEFGLRGGTKNVPGIICFGTACENIERATVPKEIGFIFLDTLAKKLIKKDGFHINGVPNGKIFNLRFDGIDSETLLLMLDACGVMVSSGSACHAHETKPGRVLKAIGLSDEEARQCIRVSFSRYNTVEEAERAAVTIAECVNILNKEENSDGK